MRSFGALVAALASAGTLSADAMTAELLRNERRWFMLHSLRVFTYHHDTLLKQILQASGVISALFALRKPHLRDSSQTISTKHGGVQHA
jgi:hypothetical protein